MAPEVLLGHAAAYDACAADVWSLGVTCFAVLIARPPFPQAWRQSQSYNVIVSGRLAALFHAWKLSVPFDFDLSPTALDMVQSLLVEDPLRRPTVERSLLTDPFFAEAA